MLISRSKIMGKEQHGTKETKKAPLLSAKEKKAKKAAKKSGVDPIKPIVPK